MTAAWAESASFEETLENIKALSSPAPEGASTLPEVVAFAVSTLTQLSALPQDFCFMPMPDGGVCFDWEDADGSCIAEIEGRGTLYLCRGYRGSENEGWRLTTYNQAALLHFMEGKPRKA